MKYLLLIYQSEQSWSGLTEQERRDIYAEYGKFSEEIKTSGHYVGGSELHPASTATSVRVRDGKALTTDGPFSETKEQLGGYYLVEAKNLDEAIDIINRNPYGNASSIFTSSGVAARRFRYEVTTGNVGINIGVAAPMAYFPFSGWKDSFLGVLHGQGWDGVEFYTDKKVVVERWPKEWSRKF